MGKYTIKDIESRAEVLKNNVDNIYRALHTKLGKSPETLDQVPQSILDIPKAPDEEPLTITPSADRQEFYTSYEKKYNPITVEPVTSAIDSNIRSENIKAGISILGVFGTLSGGTSNDFVVPNGMKFALSTFTNFPTNVDLSFVTDMSRMFSSCTQLTTIPQLDTSRATDMSYMFNECYSLTTIPLLNTSNVTSMDSMFDGCSHLTTIPLLNTSNVTSMDSMFSGCNSLTTIPQLDTSNVASMYGMFIDCFQLTTIPQLDTSKVEYVDEMFSGCDNLTTVEGIDFSGLIKGLTNLFGTTSNMPNLTRFIVNGKINVSSSDEYSIKALTAIDYDSVKSILAAANRTDNTDEKGLAFNRTIADQNGELAALVTSCTSKGWTITGLTLQ